VLLFRGASGLDEGRLAALGLKARPPEEVGLNGLKSQESQVLL
jgi:hypothetical protein